jgi:hypothetical protein
VAVATAATTTTEGKAHAAEEDDAEEAAEAAQVGEARAESLKMMRSSSSMRTVNLSQRRP